MERVSLTDNFFLSQVVPMSFVGDFLIPELADPKAGYKDDDNSLASEIYGLEGITVKPDGSMVYVSDGTRGTSVPYHRVRQIKLSK